MLTCRELAAQADALLAGELTWRQRLAIRLHIAMCRHCRTFLAQYRLMLELLPKIRDPASDEEVAAILARARIAPAPEDD